jgi:iron complex transport system substrate-binding protein
VRIVSLLPSATEIVFALGLDHELVGVSFECNYPPAARSKPIVSGTSLPVDDLVTAADIDRAVTEKMNAGEALYTLDRERIREARPDLILAQDLCRVCAIPSGDVEEALDLLGCRAEVLSLDPGRLDDVIACIGTVGAATDRVAEADELMGSLRERVERVRAQVADRPRVSTLALEWSDPPFSAGHWVPDMIEAAGGASLLANAGERSAQLEWAAIADARAEVVAFMPCGYDLDAAVAEGRGLLDRPVLAGVPQLWAVAGDEYFSRPGPRVVDGVELLAAILHPEAVRAVPPGGVRLR